MPGSPAGLSRGCCATRRRWGRQCLRSASCRRALELADPAGGPKCSASYAEHVENPGASLRTTDLRDGAAVAELFERAAEALRSSPARDHSIHRVPARGRLLATGDVHDNPAHLLKIMKLARLDQ